MEKQKKILYVILSLLCVALVAFIVFISVRIISMLFFAIAFTLLLIAIAVNIILLVNLYKKLKKEKDKQKIVSTGDYKTDLYEALGIPVQYNKDGTVKDIYDLLGIAPVYDENGNRVLTVYELLGIVPKFDEDGNEIPFVFVVKNGVKRVAKVDLSSRVLTRKLTDAEKEELLIRETLKQKLSEAEQSGDKQKKESIKKALEKPKKQEEKKEEYKPIKYTVGKGGKAISNVKLGKGLDLGNIDNKLKGSVLSMFAASAGRHRESEPERQTTTGTTKPTVRPYHDPSLLTPPPRRQTPETNKKGFTIAINANKKVVVSSSGYDHGDGFTLKIGDNESNMDGSEPSF